MQFSFEEEDSYEEEAPCELSDLNLEEDTSVCAQKQSECGAIPDWSTVSSDSDEGSEIGECMVTDYAIGDPMSSTESSLDDSEAWLPVPRTECKVPTKSNLKKVPQVFRIPGHHAIDTKVSEIYLTVDTIGIETYFQTFKDLVHSVEYPITRCLTGTLIPSVNLNVSILTMYETMRRFFEPDRDVLFYLLSHLVILDVHTDIYDTLSKCFNYFGDPEPQDFGGAMEIYTFGPNKSDTNFVRFRLFNRAERLIFLNIIIILLLIFGAGNHTQSLDTVRTVLKSFADETRATMKKDFEETYDGAKF